MSISAPTSLPLACLLAACVAPLQAQESSNGNLRVAPVARFSADLYDHGNRSDRRMLTHLDDSAVGLDVRLGGLWRAQAVLNVSGTSTQWRFLWVQRRFGDRYSVRIGNQNTGMGLEEASPASYSPFLEHPPTTSLTPGTLTGLELQAASERLTLRLGGFGSRPLDALPDRRDTYGRSLIARAVWRPVWRQSAGLAFGASAETRQLNADGNFSIAWRSEAGALDPLAAAPSLFASDRRLGVRGMETAGFFGAARLSFERLELHGGANSASGWTAGASWVLTGQRRSYRLGSASFAGFAGVHWPGAFELSVRSGRLTVNAAERQRDLAAALNWYPDQHVRVALEWASEALRLAHDIRHRHLVGLRAQYRLGSEE